MGHGEQCVWPVGIAASQGHSQCGSHCLQLPLNRSLSAERRRELGTASFPSALVLGFLNLLFLPLSLPALRPIGQVEQKRTGLGIGTD